MHNANTQVGNTQDTETILNNIPIGARVCFYTPNKLDKKLAAYQQENVLKVGNDSYSAHPYGLVSYKELMANLTKETGYAYELKEYEVMGFDDSKSKPQGKTKKNK